MRSVLVGILLLATPPLARADEERTKVELVVGQSTEIEVGFAMGHHCDDEAIVGAEMKNKTQETNVFALTGKKPGTTLCRAGTYTVEQRPTFLFEITVVAPPPPVKPPKKPKTPKTR
jgi:hypothetical protein